MKISVLFVGVIRPSIDQVKNNIKKSVEYLSHLLVNHQLDFTIVTYIDNYQSEIAQFSKDLNISIYFIPFISENEIKINLKFPNIYRLFYSMDKAISYINLNSDCVIRLRIDCQLISIQVEQPLNNTFYSIYYSKGITDNIGYGQLNTMKKIWNVNNIQFAKYSICAEELLLKIIKYYKINVIGIPFEFNLYQSPDEYWFGCKQSSKRNRCFKSDGTKMVKRD